MKAMLSEVKANIYHCLKCGACRLAFPEYMPICPSGERFGFDSYYAIGRMEIARAVFEGRLDLGEKVAMRVFTCTSCGACEEQCRPAMGNRPLKVIEELKAELVEKGFVPAGLQMFLKSIHLHGNPYQAPGEKRGDWAVGTGVEEYSGQEYLLYVGCEGSFDPRAQKITLALARILQKAGVSFGILAGRENCDGNDVMRIGERGLFEFLAQENIRTFKELGVKKIVTLSPHAYNTFKNDYPKLDGEFEVFHYTQFLRNLIREGRLVFGKRRALRVTYHDPCFLGRHNHDYGSAREVLAAVPGVDLVEMERNGRNSFCCSGGAGNHYADLLGGGGERNPARIRVREACETGAGILAVACPACALMLTEAPAAEGLEGRMTVKDVAEIVLEALQL